MPDPRQAYFLAERNLKEKYFPVVRLVYRIQKHDLKKNAFIFFQILTFTGMS